MWRIQGAIGSLDEELGNHHGPIGSTSDQETFLALQARAAQHTQFGTHHSSDGNSIASASSSNHSRTKDNSILPANSLLLGFGNRRGSASSYHSSPSSYHSRSESNLPLSTMIIPKDSTHCASTVDEEDASASVLEDTIRIRDETIRGLLRTRKVEQSILKETQSELQRLKVKYKTDVRKKETIIELLSQERDNLNRRIETFEADLYDEDLVGGLAELVAGGNPKIAAMSGIKAKDNWNTSDAHKKKNPNARDADYVKQLELKLCKAMHKMQVMENQVKLLKKSSLDFARKVKEDIKIDREERDAIEIQYLNKLVAIQNEKRTKEEGLLAKLESKEEHIERLSNTIEELQELAAADHNDDDHDNKGTNGTNGEALSSSSKAKKREAIASVVALTKIKEQFDKLSKESYELNAKHTQEKEELEAEISRLQEANEKKQKKIDTLETSFNMSAIEGDMNGNWNEREYAQSTPQRSLPTRSSFSENGSTDGGSKKLARTWKNRDDERSVKSTDTNGTQSTGWFSRAAPLSNELETQQDDDEELDDDESQEGEESDSDDDESDSPESPSQEEGKEVTSTAKYEDHLATLMTQIASVTREMENDLKESLAKKERVLKSLDEDDAKRKIHDSKISKFL